MARERSGDMTAQSRVRTIGNFFRIVEIDVSEATHHPDAFDQLRRGDLHGVMVHNLYRPDTLNEVVEHLERHDPPFIKTWFPVEFQSWFFGRNLNLTELDLHQYFHEAVGFHNHLEDLFPPSLGLTTYVASVLSQLDHGRPFRSPPGPNPGEHYMFTTLRAHLEGGFIPPHCDNEQAVRPSYQHLQTLIEPQLMSFVLAFTIPEAGGAVEVFNHRIDPLGTTLIPKQTHPNLDELDSVSFRLPAGTMIILDSGRYLHRLTPVVGSQKRWNACSFMALSRQHDAVYCWG
jgi:hypothetical protein